MTGQDVYNRIVRCDPIGDHLPDLSDEDLLALIDYFEEFHSTEIPPVPFSVYGLALAEAASRWIAEH